MFRALLPIIGSKHYFITSFVYLWCFLWLVVRRTPSHFPSSPLPFFDVAGFTISLQFHMFFHIICSASLFFSFVFDSIYFNAPLNLSPPNYCLQGSYRWFCYVPYGVVMALLVLLFQYLFTFDLSRMVLHWCNASLDSFFSSSFQVDLNKRSSLPSCVANHLLHFP